MRLRRGGQFDELVARQLSLFAGDETDLLQEAAEAEDAWVRSGRDTAEEAYGDYQLVVDALADRLLEIREAYAATLTGDTADAVPARIRRGRRASLSPIRVARRRPGAVSYDASSSSRSSSGRRGRSERASFR